MSATYVDPIAARYASDVMRELFSPRQRALAWRDLWIALARAQHEMNLNVTLEQVQELEAHRDEVDLERVAEHEKRLRHDVMAHLHAYGEVAPGAKGILHLGATSCFVTDNADLVLMRRALRIVDERLLRMIHTLSEFALERAELPALGLTHLQPAQLTTVGKRASLWLQDLVHVREQLNDLLNKLPLRGAKGTTGTQASYLHLFDGDASKVDQLEARIAELMGFDKVFELTGQTYSRLWDFRIINTLAELGVALHKFSTDLRLLQSWGELEEPFEKDQVGSSAMPYKRNPMRSERMGALSKLLISQPAAVGNMAATQWMERTLDDSALRRVAIPQAFLTSDALLIIGRNVCDGLIVHESVVARRVREYLPFLASEELLMQGVTQGGDRQELHERLRQLSWQAAEALREEGQNPLQDLLAADPQLGPVLKSLPPWEGQRFTGLAAHQVRRYVENVIKLLPVPPEDEVRQLSV